MWTMRSIMAAAPDGSPKMPRAGRIRQVAAEDEEGVLSHAVWDARDALDLAHDDG